MAVTDEGTELLTQTAPGTPMGELLRRYWHPVALVGELTTEQPILAVKILSEKLVIYRSVSGVVGMMQDRCTHHGYLMTYGWVEENSIMCGVHGWQFDLAGNCFISYASKIYPIPDGKAVAYPVRRCAGLYWAYLGPLPAPAFPAHEFLTRRDGQRRLTAYPVEEQSPVLAPVPPTGGLWLRTPVDDTHLRQFALDFVPSADGVHSDPTDEEPAVELRTTAPRRVGVDHYVPWAYADPGDLPRAARHGGLDAAALRALWLAQLERVQQGHDPLGVTRDPGAVATGS